jgi:hypothetical protein
VIISRRSKQREVSPRRRDRLIASSNANTKSRAFSLSLSLSLSLSSERVDVPRLRGQAPRTGDPSIRIARGGNERLTFSTPFHLARCSSPFLPSSLSLSLSLYDGYLDWLPRRTLVPRPPFHPPSIVIDRVGLARLFLPRVTHSRELHGVVALRRPGAVDARRRTRALSAISRAVPTPGDQLAAVTPSQQRRCYARPVR